MSHKLNADQKRKRLRRLPARKTALSADAKKALEEALGHRFKNEALLVEALTHASFKHLPSNERLEFLGDRILGLVIAETLLNRYKDDAEGKLAVRLNQLVDKGACEAVAKQLGLGDFLVLSPGEIREGGREKTTILANAIEAIIAALYLDGGMVAAKSFIDANWAVFFEEGISASRDAKGALQEWAQGRGLEPPVYEIIAHEGPAHDPLFTVSANLEGQTQVKAQGKSRKLAETAAAQKMLDRLS